VEGGTLLAKNTHNLQVSKYKTDYAAGKVKAGDEKEALEAGVKGELLHLGKSVYGRVDRSKFAPLLDQAADVAPGPAAVTPPATPPGEQVPPLKDPKSIVIDELPGEAIVEIEEVYVSPARINADGVEEVTVGSKKMSLEEMLAYDLQQTIDGLKMPTFEFEEEQVSAAK
jgi:hypothetical protein